MHIRGPYPLQVALVVNNLEIGALGRPRGIRWRGRWERGLGWGIHVYPRLIHVSVWQKPLQYCKIISLQLIKKVNKLKNKQTNKKEIPVWSQGWEDPLEEGMEIHSNIFAWRIPWKRSLAGYGPWGCRVGHDWSNWTPTHKYSKLFLDLNNFWEYKGALQPKRLKITDIPTLQNASLK